MPGTVLGTGYKVMNKRDVKHMQYLYYRESVKSVCSLMVRGRFLSQIRQTMGMIVQANRECDGNHYSTGKIEISKESTNTVRHTGAHLGKYVWIITSGDQ